ncbi:MAG: PilZ domain-containing protein [Acidiferrobacterales bacterium]
MTDKERRTAVRKHISQDILINYGSANSEPWKTRDVSTGGALVGMPAASVPLSQDVEAILTLKPDYRPGREPPTTEVVRILAQVVRVSDEGIALKFCDYDNRTYTALVNRLYGP